MDEVYAAPGAPDAGERGQVGGLLVTALASIAAGGSTGVAAWAVQAASPPAGAWAGVATASLAVAVGAYGARASGWAIAALTTSVSAGLVAAVGLVMSSGPEPTAQLPIVEASIRSIGVQLLSLWVWALASAVALRVPRGRLGAFVGAYVVKWTLVLVGFQFVLPGIAFALLGALVEVSAARQDGWGRYVRDLGGNLGPATVVVLSAGLGAGLSMAATLALYGFEGFLDGSTMPLEGHVVASLLAGVPATLGLWLAGRIASLELTADR